MILCCKCGTLIQPNQHNMCNLCLTTEINPFTSLQTSLTVEHCRQCDRFFTPPKHWSSCSWHSKEMLLHLINRNKSLSKFTLIDSDFLFTEEHSKQIAISVTLSPIKEYEFMVQSFTINYRIRNMQCPDCQKVEAKQYWSSIVQVRQRVKHKKTLLYLEQLILKAKAFNDTSNIKERRDGIDFYYLNKTHALRMVSFIKETIMSKVKISERLITEDKKSNTAKYKFSYSIEIVPLCRDDLIIVSDRIARKYGINPVNIILKVNSNFKMIDPISLKVTEIDSRNYWGYQDEFKVLMSRKNLKKFVITEKEETGVKNGKYAQSTLFVTRGLNDSTHCKTHLGHLLKEGQTVLGYDFENSSLNDVMENNFKVFIVGREKKKSKGKYKSKKKEKVEMREIEEEEILNEGGDKERLCRNFSNMGIN